MLRKRTSKSESVTLQYQSEIDNIYIATYPFHNEEG